MPAHIQMNDNDDVKLQQSDFVKDQEHLFLSNAERDRFLVLLEQEPKPIVKLKTAMKKYLSMLKAFGYRSAQAMRSRQQK